jgi:hypothetical protein
MTKLINGGNPAYILQVGIIEAMRVHISPASVSDEILTKRSRFLSFSSDKKRALHFAATGSPELLVPGEGQDQRYLISLNVSAMEKTEASGLYSLKYDCSLEPCEYCDITQGRHELLLIDAVRFLAGNSSSTTSADALDNAKRDKEWLVLPVDYIPRLNDFSARISPSDIWTVEDYHLGLDSGASSFMKM